MSPPEHILVGFSTGNILFASLLFIKKKSIKYNKFIILIIIAALLPDVDSFFGNYTSANPILGHRGVTHSILGAFVFAIILTIVYYFIKQREMSNIKYGLSIKEWEILAVDKEHFIIFTACFIGGLTHVICDLPQPGSVWKGVPVLFPYKKDGVYHRMGGYGYIGWYDYKILINLFIAAAASSFALLLHKAREVFKKEKFQNLIIISIISINLFTLGWIAKYTISDKYSNKRQWEKYQAQVIETYPKGIQVAVIEGRKQFLKIFNVVLRTFR